MSRDVKDALDTTRLITKLILRLDESELDDGVLFRAGGMSDRDVDGLGVSASEVSGLAVDVEDFCTHHESIRHDRYEVASKREEESSALGREG
jgi:hypothetical protein